jgi:SAM-dependent MidA family methyltransferase
VGDTPGDRIRERIRTDGPITFATFMELVLYGPGGFYDEPPIGADGDFVTGPHVHPTFGAFVARAIEALRAAIDASPLRVTEVGAGDGTLARQIVEALPDVTYRAVEISAGSRRALDGIDGVEVTEMLAPPADVIVAHELLDNLPFRIVRDDAEIRVGLTADDTLTELPVPLDDALREATGDGDDGGGGGGEIVVPTGALSFIDRIAEVLERGYALLIDYGDEGSAGPVHGYRAHRPIADVLGSPGDVDVTAGVDFGWIARHARTRGLQAFPFATQSDVLLALGFEGWLRSELASQQEQLAAGSGLDAVRTWSGRSRATLLVDPAALGRMRWLLLATEGLPSPAWLNAAQG